MLFAPQHRRRNCTQTSVTSTVTENARSKNSRITFKNSTHISFFPLSSLSHGKMAAK